MKNVIEMLVNEYEDIVVYGAGGVAKAVCRLLKECCTEKNICIAVSKPEGNPRFLEGFQVYSVESMLDARYKKNALFIMAMMPAAAGAVKAEMTGRGCRNILTAEEMAEKMYKSFYSHPVQKGKILFVNFSGRGYGCNPKYICEEIRGRDWDFADCVWAVGDGDAGLPDGVRAVPYGSYQYYYELATAQVWVDNQHKDFISQKREGQFYIQTWHGCGPLKKIEYDAESLPGSYLEMLDRDMEMVDLCISGAGFNSMLFRRAFRYNGDILECGCPRNDILLKQDFPGRKIRKKLGIPEGVSVILYAPTLRDGESNRIDVPRVSEACCQLFEKDCFVLIREHPQMKLREGRYLFSDRVINASDYPDIQELLAVSDLLITDYSSVMWDFSLQRKPVFLYHPDVNVYEEERGIYISFSQMPYIEAFSMEDLCEKICGYEEETYKQELEGFLRKYESFDGGEAAKIVVNRIWEVIKDE